jgi:hypothetical protein
MKQIEIKNFDDLKSFCESDTTPVPMIKKAVKATLNAFIIEERKDIIIIDLCEWWEHFKNAPERPPFIFNPKKTISRCQN